jgi:rod shape-determining protein MreD
MEIASRHEILLPVRPSFIVLTLVCAVLLNMLLGWAGPFRPDFVALVVLYWCVHQPRIVGFIVAFSMGLLMDVAEGTLLGQHALAYCLLAFAGIALHRRVQGFRLTAQIAHVIPLLLVTDLIVVGTRLLGGASFPGYSYFLGSVIAGLLWPVVSVLLKLPQRPRADPDHV